MQKRRVIYIFILLSLVIAAFYPQNARASQIIYVDDDATGFNDGSSWENAYVYLQDALSHAKLAQESVEIHVAQGIYTPDKGIGYTPEDYFAAFELINDVNLFGGYAGVLEEDPNYRDIKLYETFLSGDLLNNDVNTIEPNNLIYDESFLDNSFHVIISSSNEKETVLDGFTITGGNAGANYLNFDSDSRGGGIYIEKGEPTIANCTFLLNGAILGGAIFNNNSEPNISNCSFKRNSANYYYINEHFTVGGDGGAVYNTQSSPVFSNCEFEDNYGTSGGGMYNYEDSNEVLINCSFINNEAVMYGGGIYNHRSNLIITDCNFSGNYADRNGGAISNNLHSDSVINNCVFISNQSYEGSGIYNYISGPNLENCVFTENTASFAGGGIASENSAPNLISCTFEKNQAYAGAGIYNYDCNSIILNCNLSNNTSEQYGGAILNFFGNSLIKNCIFSGNSTATGGGIFNTSGNFTFINCTFFGNIVQNTGNAIVMNSSPPLPTGNLELLNCILWDGENAIVNLDGSEFSIDYSDVQNGLLAIDDPMEKLIWGQGNFDMAPCFVEPGLWIDINDPNIIVEPNDPNATWREGDYHLKSTAGHFDPNSKSWIIDDVNSPCIDAGDPNSSLVNEPLPNGQRINIGAYGGTSQASMSPGEPLVAYWALDEIDGNIAYDQASDNDANIVEPQWAEDRMNGTLHMNGINSYMDCGDSETLGTRQMTISLWVKPSEISEIKYILSRAMPDLSVIDYTLMIHSQGNIELEIGQGNGESLYILSNGTIPFEQWTHLAITLNGSLASIYINANLDVYAKYDYREANQNYNLTIGSLQDGTGNYNGILDDIRIYNLALNQEQIELLAQ